MMNTDTSHDGHYKPFLVYLWPHGLSQTGKNDQKINLYRALLHVTQARLVKHTHQCFPRRHKQFHKHIVYRLFFYATKNK